MSAPLLLRAHAKINLGLSVLARRGDGFHEVDTLFVRLDLHDEIILEPRGDGVSAERLPSGDPQVARQPLPMEADNLVVRAARTYLAEAGLPGGVHIGLRKNIPIAAGLGGGSSDAAAVLQGLSRLYPAGIELDALANTLGSDVAFFLSGLPAARGRGRGERLTPVAVPPRTVVLANPGVEVPVKEAYARLQTFSSRLDLEGLLGQLAGGMPPRYQNALQPGVTLAFPAVREVLAELRAAELQSPLLSGSGPTCFGLAASEAEAVATAREMSARKPGWWIKVASFV